MLYLTTRNNNDIYTSYKALSENFAPDGGGYVPYKLPALDHSDLASLSIKPFSECVAAILNLFFSSKLTGWDVEFAIGRNPLKLVQLSSKISVAELWANPEDQFGYFVKTLYHCIVQKNLDSNQPTEWVEIAVRIAMLFGVWGDMIRRNIITMRDTFDLSVSFENYYTATAALYARRMGLPIACTILACNEGNPIWSFINRGEVRADALSLSESKTVERILQHTLGCQESARYLCCREHREQYILTDDAGTEIKNLLFAASIGGTRSSVTMHNVAKKDGYPIIRNTASAYGALEDFRAHFGISKHALLFAESGI